MKVWIVQLATYDSPTTEIGIPILGVFSSLGRVWDFIMTDELAMGVAWWGQFAWRRYHDEYFEGWNEEEVECVLIYTMEVDALYG